MLFVTFYQWGYWGPEKLKKCRPGYPASKGQSGHLNAVHNLHRPPFCLSVRWDPVLICSGLTWKTFFLAETSPSKASMVSFLPLWLVFILMGLDCTSLQLIVPWDKSYRWNHSDLTFGNTGQFPLLWTPILTSNIPWNMWAVSQRLKGTFLYRHLCCKGICCDRIWAA